jgi:hypothetical protein
MSLNINITVDSNDLINQDKNTRTALRYTKAGNDNQLKIEEKSSIQRKKEAKAKGLESNGKTFYSVQTLENPKIDEPTAVIRLDGVAHGFLRFYQYYVGNQYTDSAMAVSSGDDTQYVEVILPSILGDPDIQLHFGDSPNVYNGFDPPWINTQYPPGNWPAGFPFDRCGYGYPIYVPNSGSQSQSYCNQFGLDGFEVKAKNTFYGYYDNNGNYQPGSIDEYEFASDAEISTILGTTVEYLRYGSETDTGKYDLAIFHSLPIDSKTFILYYSEQHYRYDYYYGGSTKYTMSFVDLNSGPAYYEHFFPGTVNNPQPVLRQAWYKYIASSLTISTFEHFNDEYYSSATLEKCFLVSERAVREISVPSELSAKMSEIYKWGVPTPGPEAQSTATTTTTTTVDTITIELIPNLTIDNSPIPLATGGSCVVSSSPGMTITSTNDLLTWEYYLSGDQPDENGEYYHAKPEYDISAAYSYGMGYNRTSGFQGYMGLSTAGIYDILGNGSRLLEDSWENDMRTMDYNYIKENYFSQIPSNRVVEVISQFKFESYSFDFELKIGTATLTNQFTPIDTSSFSSLDKFSYPITPENVSDQIYVNNVHVLLAWDWGRPAYCRQQLLALGFSASDLVPTIPNSL